MIWRLVAVFFVAVTCYAQSYSVNGDPQLELYMDEALAKNPSAQEAFGEYRAALQKLPQVRSLPDPMLAATQYLAGRNPAWSRRPRCFRFHRHSPGLES